MKALDEKLGRPNDVNYIHITVDPEADSPQMALEYLKKHEIDPQRDRRWFFLLGKKREIEPILKSFGVSVRKISMGRNGYLIEHTPKVVIYDKTGEMKKELNRQEVIDIKVLAPENFQIIKERRHENKIIFVEREGRNPFQVQLNCLIRRYQTGAIAERLLMGDRERYYFLPEKCKITPDIAAFADKVVGKEKDPYKIGRRIYDGIIDYLTYDRDIPGCGTGDSSWIYRSRRGKCDDFHSLLMTMAVYKKIPVKWEQGFPLPYPSQLSAKKGEMRGDCTGAHCWASLYIEGKGWIPLDASEANKRADLRDFLYGHVTPNRFQVSRGRDVILSPPHEGDPLNTFAYAYAEADGIPMIYGKHYHNTVKWEVERIVV